MPLLMCPNDNAAMTTVERSGVQFDMCPTCRGVWLDRGELEKLMQAAVDEAPRVAQPAPPPQAAPAPPYPTQPPPQQPWGYGERGERGEWGERGEYGERGYGYRKKRPSIFDIFD
ncbi:TFIIB-type zinc ribbon-containing protein [Brevundimonas balnearis]|uniref:Zf-TFIIB domain-containing protein n=1 Tax=Brevundimonas balnearis TaxID=1572858 RepID=A0ABV6R243_9CAUL